MDVTVNPTQLKKVIRAGLACRQPILITGAPGIGKTDILHEAAYEADHEVMVSHPVVADPTDAKGLPFAVEGENGEKIAKFLPYGDMLKAIYAEKPLVWVLDDLGQAPPAVQASYMQLLLSRQINGHQLPEHVSFIAATNRRQDRAGVTGILEPVKSRFGTIVELEADLEDWTRWALNHGIAMEMIAFLRFRPELLSKFEATADMANSPSPRTWAKLNEMMQHVPKELLYTVAAGAVGEGAASEFYAFMDVYKEMPNPDAVLMNPDGFEAPENPAVNYALVGALAKKASEQSFDRICKVAPKFQKPFEICLVKDSVQLAPEVQQTEGFIRWASDNSNVLL